MTIDARFASKCTACGGSVSIGSRVEWSRGVRGVRHTSCETAREATPGDASSAPRLNRIVRSARYGSNYARFSSGAESFSNARGRCEDAPCCGCCS